MGENKPTAGKYSWAAAFTVASVWFGTHVGGGFASGNQVIQYFSQYGITAAIYPLIAMGILGSIINVGVELWRKSSRAFLSCQKKKQWSINNKTFRI